MFGNRARPVARRWPGNWLRVLIVLIAAVPLTSTGQGAPIFNATLAEEGERAPEVSTDELKAILARRSALVLDARPSREFGLGHIPGAVNVPGKPGLPTSQYTADEVPSCVLVGPAVGFPIVVSLAWIFDVKAGRIERTGPSTAAPTGVRLGLLLRVR